MGLGSVGIHRHYGRVVELQAGGREIGYDLLQDVVFGNCPALAGSLGNGVLAECIPDALLIN